MIKLFAFASSSKLKQPKEGEEKKKKKRDLIWKAVRITVW